MKAIQMARTGAPDVLTPVELPVPKPGPGEVLVKAHAIGVAYFDMLIRTGRYPWMPALPYVPGNALSGTVADANGTALAQGTPVYVANWDNGYRGGFYADYLVAAAAAVRPLPARADLDAAAALDNYVVACCMLDHGARGVDLGTIVIRGAAGGMGLALAELARLAGAKAIGIAGSDEKCALLRERGIEPVNHAGENIVERVLDLTGGRGADLVCNHVAGATFADDLKMVAPFGLVMSYGVLGGLPDRDTFRDLRANVERCPALRCFTMHAFDHRPELRDRCTDKVMKLFADGKLSPLIAQRLPLDEAAKAHTLLERRGTIGKILLKP